MALFGKKKKKQEETIEIKNDIKSSDKIVFEELISTDDSYITNLAKKIIDGNPLVLNFEKLDVDSANKVIAFMSGVVFTIKGEIIHIQEKVFMFSTKESFVDGSIDQFLKEIK